MSPPLQAPIVIIGAGVVGLAVAEQLSRRCQGIFVLERGPRFGLETSSRNSEVVHGGLYYEPDSFKARLCLEGAARLEEWCGQHHVPFVPCGKLVVALDERQEGALHALHDNARRSGAPGLELWSPSQMRRTYPQIPATLALFSAKTSVVDSYELMRSLLERARARGVDLALRHELRGLEVVNGRWRCHVRSPEDEPIVVEADLVINAAGHGADTIAAAAGIDIDEAGYRIHPSKGDYFAISGRARRGITHLLYPLPDKSLQSLGVHLTVDVGGSARLGPDATHIEPGWTESAYKVDEAKSRAFLEAGRRLLPWLTSDDLSPERSGVRPKLSGPGEPARDFVIAHERERGLGGLINLVGIDSPGLTSAMAIAAEVLRILARDGAL